MFGHNSKWESLRDFFMDRCKREEHAKNYRSSIATQNWCGKLANEFTDPYKWRIEIWINPTDEASRSHSYLFNVVVTLLTWSLIKHSGWGDRTYSCHTTSPSCLTTSRKHSNDRPCRNHHDTSSWCKNSPNKQKNMSLVFAHKRSGFDK